MTVNKSILVTVNTEPPTSADSSEISQIRLDLIKFSQDPMRDGIDTEYLVVGHGKMYPNPYEQVFSVTEGSYKLACYNVYRKSTSINGDAITGTFSVDSNGVITSNLPAEMTIGDPHLEEGPLI